MGILEVQALKRFRVRLDTGFLGQFAFLEEAGSRLQKSFLARI